jgi:hypothetical protein
VESAAISAFRKVGPFPNPQDLDQRSSAPATATSLRQDCDAAGVIQTEDAACARPTEASARSDQSNTLFDDTTALAAAKGVSSGSSSSPSSETVTRQGSGFVFNNTYGSGVSVTFCNEIVAAENYLQSIFSNACTVNCTFDVQTLDPEYGGENFPSYVDVSYSEFVAALASHAIMAPALAAAASLANLPDPNTGALFEVSTGEAQILGLAGTGTGIDDSIVLGIGASTEDAKPAIGTLRNLAAGRSR